MLLLLLILCSKIGCFDGKQIKYVVCEDFTDVSNINIFSICQIRKSKTSSCILNMLIENVSRW